MTDRFTLTIKPEPGQQAFLWVSGDDDRGSLGIACCSMASRCDIHPCSRELHRDFQAWLSRLEHEPLQAHPRECLDIDWQGFHREGLALACRLKAEVGSAFRVICAKPLQDPAWRRSERVEVHDDQSVTSLPITSTSTPMRLEDLLSGVVSGGQTGADRAALDWAIDAGLPHGGWCPLGRHAEDGELAPQYRLRETEGSGARQRTKRNVRDSDGTLILNRGALDGGSRQTAIFAQRMGKPVFIVQLDREPHVQAARRVLHWLHAHPIATLNVAGPRESKRPGIYRESRDLLIQVSAAGAEDADELSIG